MKKIELAGEPKAGAIEGEPPDHRQSEFPEQGEGSGRGKERVGIGAGSALVALQRSARDRNQKIDWDAGNFQFTKGKR